MSKPTIRYSSVIEQWKCIGRGQTEYGDTPSQAYARWRVLTDLYKHYFADRYDSFEKYNNRPLAAF